MINFHWQFSICFLKKKFSDFLFEKITIFANESFLIYEPSILTWFVNNLAPLPVKFLKFNKFNLQIKEFIILFVLVKKIMCEYRVFRLFSFVPLGKTKGWINCEFKNRRANEQNVIKSFSSNSEGQSVVFWIKFRVKFMGKCKYNLIRPVWTCKLKKTSNIFRSNGHLW